MYVNGIVKFHVGDSVVFFNNMNVLNTESNKQEYILSGRIMVITEMLDNDTYILHYKYKMTKDEIIKNCVH